MEVYGKLVTIKKKHGLLPILEKGMILLGPSPSK